MNRKLLKPLDQFSNKCAKMNKQGSWFLCNCLGTPKTTKIKCTNHNPATESNPMWGEYLKQKVGFKI